MLHFKYRRKGEMELTKILHDVYEASKHWHLPLFASITSSFEVNGKEGNLCQFLKNAV